MNRFYFTKLEDGWAFQIGSLWVRWLIKSNGPFSVRHGHAKGITIGKRFLWVKLVDTYE
jgi:hypothetical protein